MVRTGAVVKALLVAVLAVCLTGSSGNPPPRPPAGILVLGDVAIAPAVDPGGIVFSLVLRNESEQPVTVLSVVPVADDEVSVDVLGITGCRAGCAGAMGWTEAQPLLTRLPASPEGVVVPPESSVRRGRADAQWVVLRVAARDAGAEAGLRGHCLVVEDLLVKPVGGPWQPLRHGMQPFVVALDAPDAGMPGVPRHCDLL